MSWLQGLFAELTARGVSAGDRRRIIAELEDHIACDPDSEARLGDPAQLAATFADELATSSARGSAYRVFAALATTAIALVLPQLLLGRASNPYPGFTHGLSLALFFPALLGMFVAPQVALVAGTLAAWRALRHRSARLRPAAELALIRRRAWVALGGGLATVVGIELYVIDFVAVLPAWWLALTAGLAAIAGAALLAAARELGRAGALRSTTPGRSGDVFDDLPLINYAGLRRHPWGLGAFATLLVGLVMTLFVAHAERSLIEGLERGLAEALAAAAGFVVLGRAVGILGSKPPPLLSAAGLAGLPSDRLVADHDRDRVELLLRDAFGSGRLDLEQLTFRLEIVHSARTVSELRRALNGLPPDH